MKTHNPSSPLVRRTAWPARLLLSSFILVAAACGGGGDGPTDPGNPGNPGNPGTPVVTTSVDLQGNAFDPSAIQVSPGATVTFTNKDATNHTVTFSNSSITSVDAFSSGARTVIMPTAAGTYAYHCTIHAGMNGSVKVQ